MAYSSNYYNYQIAIIFGILIAGCLLLALTVGAIYFLCVYKNTDDEKKKRAAAFNSRGTAWQPNAQPGTYTNLNAPNIPVQPVEYLPPRAPAQSSYVPPPPSAYSQQPLMQPYTTGGQPVYRTIAPDTIYQQAYIEGSHNELPFQGPTTFRTVTPVHETTGYGGSPQQGFSYHTSSV